MAEGRCRWPENSKESNRIIRQQFSPLLSDFEIDQPNAIQQA